MKTEKLSSYQVDTSSEENFAH